MENIKEITLWGFGASLKPDRIDPSSFVTKAYSFLRINSIPFKFRTGTMSPVANRCPWLEITFKDPATPKTIIEDSQRIVVEMTKLFSIKMDDHLTQDQKIQGEALRLVVENTMYQALIRRIWVDNPNYVIENYPIPLPMPVRGWMIGTFRKGVITACNEHGNGDLSDEESWNTWLSGLKFIALTLGKKKFLFSDDVPSSYDCAVFFFCKDADLYPSKVRDFLKANPQLGQYAQRMTTLAFPDFDELHKSSRAHFDKTKASLTTKLSIGAAVAAAALAVAGYYLVRYFKQ